MKNFDHLTTREIEVLELICQQLTNAEIADRLCLSQRTVETYRYNMMDKVGARNTVGLVLFAVQKGYCTPTPQAHLYAY